MIKELRIQNFKCWKDTGKVNLAPLTVLFGCNSSGKSSIGQFLMLLKQSIESADRKSVFLTGSENTTIDLGQPSDLIYNKDLDKSIIFSYRWNTDTKNTFRDALSKTTYTFDEVKFKGEVGVSDVTTQTLEVPSFSYQLYNNDSGNFMKVGMSRKEQNSSSKRAYQLDYDNYNFVRSKGRVWDITPPIRFYGFPDEAVAYYQNASFLQLLNLAQENLFANIYYLGPLRTRAKRLYTWNGRIPTSVGTLGGDAVQAILSADHDERSINLKYHSPRKSFSVIIAQCLKKMELIDEFKIERISEKRQDYEVKVRTVGSKNWVDIPDVGVGVSQVLPVLVELFYAPAGSTILMEQPELHLHPKAQAGLADVIIDAIHARENYENRNIQLIIETHSEHFLRRLQRRVAEDVLSTEEFTAYFTEMIDGTANLELLQVDLFGSIANWPENFFGDIDGDIYLQTKAALKKKANQEVGEN